MIEQCFAQKVCSRSTVFPLNFKSIQSCYSNTISNSNRLGCFSIRVQRKAKNPSSRVQGFSDRTNIFYLHGTFAEEVPTYKHKTPYVCKIFINESSLVNQIFFRNKSCYVYPFWWANIGCQKIFQIIHPSSRPTFPRNMVGQ